MRVNVTYSIELEEVKQLVKELLLKAESNLEELQESFLKVKETVKKNQEVEALSHLKACRESLSSLDHGLYDSAQILTGYKQTSLQMEAEQKAMPDNSDPGKWEPVGESG